MKKDSAEILNQYEDFLRERELAENTIDAYTMSVRDFFSAHTEVTKQAGLAWKRELLEQGKKPQTVNVRLNAYNSLCEMLGMEGSKCKTIKIHQATAVSNVIPVSEYERLLRCLEQDKNWKWFYGVKLLAMTGARVSEYIRLQKKDFDRGYAEMWTKGKIRRIYIPKQFRDEAAAYYANAEPDDYLMPSRYGGQMSSRGVAEMLQKYAIKYGIDPKYMHPHSFRHLFAIEFLKRNNNLSLRRSPGAIQRRCADLGLKARPVRINPHGPEAVWHQEDYDRLAEGIKSGESYMSISKALGKSEKAIRGKVYYCYLTENADKVRAMMAGGNWGDGAPEPTVWQARLLSRSRAEMQTTMTMLVEALNCRIRQVGYDPALEDHWNQYWQRTTCLHWDDLKHCTAGCTDCDSCAEYKKIPPQYCARCGATFYERKENTFCLQCRFDRKKQAQRHWCRVNAKRGERP